MLLSEKHFCKKWQIVPLSEAVEFLDNLRKPVKASERVEGEYAYYGANGFQGTINDYIFDQPLVLLAEDGGHFGNTKKDIAYIADGKYWVNNHAHVLKPKENVDLNFLFRVLQRYDVTPYIKGATRAKLTKGDAGRIPFPLPPLDEQKRIAAILDKADAIRQKRKQAIALADEFLRSVFLDMFGDPLANPKNHTVRNLGELCNLITDGKHGDCEDEENSGYFFVSAKNVRNGELCLDGSRQINKKEFLEVHKRTCLEPGALLLVNTGATIGKVAILPQSEIVSRCTLQKSVAVIKPKKEILNNEFLMKIIQLRVNDFASKGSGSAIKNLLLSQIREFPIILPSIELQEKYAVIAKNVKENKVHQKESGLALNDFFNSLSQKAFSGQL